MSTLPKYRVLLLDNPTALDALRRMLDTEDSPSAFALEAISDSREAEGAVRRYLNADDPFALAFVGGDYLDGAEALRKLDPEIELVLLGVETDANDLARRLPPADKLLCLGWYPAQDALKMMVESLCARWETRTQHLKEHRKMVKTMRQRAEEHRSLEDQLRQSQKMEALGTLAGGIAHDFNNILGVVMGYAELIRETAGTDPELKRRVGEILSAGGRARDLINQILNFSRQTPSEVRSVRLEPLAQEALRLLRSSLPANVELNWIMDSEDDLAAVDATQFHQVLFNLCTNAAQAMEETGGTVTVTLSDAASDKDDPHVHGVDDPRWFLRLKVSDDGPGVPRDLQSKIFDPFFTTKKPGKGTGMGLSVVHGVVRHHGGHIALDSEPGEGTMFSLYLPRAPRETAPSFEPTPVLAPMHGRVLFVDDEKPLVDIGREILEGFGFEVVGRTSSIEALEAFRFRPDDFDLIISDYAMPNMTGLEFAKEVLRLRPDIPVILCTGFSEAISYERVRAVGVSDLVMKPILKSKLVQSVGRLLEQKGRTEED